MHVELILLLTDNSDQSLRDQMSNADLRGVRGCTSRMRAAGSGLTLGIFGVRVRRNAIFPTVTVKLCKKILSWDDFHRYSFLNSLYPPATSRRTKFKFFRISHNSIASLLKMQTSTSLAQVTDIRLARDATSRSSTTTNISAEWQLHAIDTRNVSNIRVSCIGLKLKTSSRRKIRRKVTLTVSSAGLCFLLFRYLDCQLCTSF